MKNIIIAGAGKGIGLASAELLADRNNVIAVTRSKSTELENMNVQVFYSDLSLENSADTILLPDEIHGLVYCPGSINLKPFNRLTTEDFLVDFKQNVLGAVKLIQHCLPNLKRSKNASVVLFSTVAVKTGMSFHSSISVSKGGVEGLVRSLAAEFASANIRFNGIAPSLTETSLASALLNTPEKKEAAAKRHPLQRIGNATEIASLVEYLLSDNATWMTGQVIGLDGGLGNLK